MEYRRGRITQEYRRWGRRARLARFRARSQAARGVPLVASRRQLPRPILQRSSPARTGQRDSDRSDRDSGSDDSRLRPVYLLRHRAVPLPRSFLKEAASMPAWLATCSVVCRLTLPLRRRAAYVVAALLFTAAVPGWALSPVALVDLGSDTTFACGRIPAGGYLLVWQNLSQGLSVQRFTEAGERLGPAKNLDIGPPNEQVFITSVVVGDSGGWGVFWTESTVPDEVNVGGALFDAQDKLLQRMRFPDPIPDPGALIIDYHPLAIALAGGGFFVASEVGTQDDPTASPLQPTRTDVYVMKLDAAGREGGDAGRH